MKKITILFLLSALFSCGENEDHSSSNIFENLTFSVDTVLVDAGEDFFNLNYGIGSSDVNEDKSELMFFENSPHKLVRVDLDQLKLKSKTEFEEEGPNGIGPYLTGFELGPNQLFIQSYTTMALFDMQGKLIKDLKIVPEGIDPDLAGDYVALFGNAIYDFQVNKIFTQPSFEKSGEYGLYVTDPNAKTTVSYPIPKMKIVDDLSGTFQTKSGEYTNFYYYSTPKYTTSLPGKLIISCAPMSGIYLFDKETNQMEFKDIQHQSVPNVMQVDIDNNPTSEDAVKENRRKLGEQLNYQSILWDESRDMFWRFGKKTFQGAEKGDPNTYEFYLFAYDQDFNVLGETKLKDLENEPRNYFFKDGKLWSYVNVEDELGFAVFTFDF
ncbi:DUF4221 family protein [Algoriphagus sp. PAP.12]|uniref:DUF4221 family protein n=1 Tax=Algoriphagus sp. PAP.12 TaxID=2996678 RepID=UPI00227C9C55|nr:DUF4221 family protein [Algoriphagus sp. PAP.12]